MSELAFSVTEKVRQLAYEEGFHDGYDQAMSEMPEVVKCKDCKNIHLTPYGSNAAWCPLLNIHINDQDFFCKIGEREKMSK